MDRTDEELDRDWVPNGRRPQSTIARSFSAELMDIFRIENSVADLDEQIDRRYVSQHPQRGCAPHRVISSLQAGNNKQG
ncbi:hypothetical protein O1611_g3601 [Lasiodiplodia mahajangana]|uniref:Uncharacterized protein n=1 Tax=Lasiodiplodia mahajangana TaxID=1108764 RepID=A0ACC2JRZ0_9PEZI|nr:hypothetical protein O1611_g3601 [Lasiodiplodia mahajangana]